MLKANVDPNIEVKITCLETVLLSVGPLSRHPTIDKMMRYSLRPISVEKMEEVREVVAQLLDKLDYEIRTEKAGRPKASPTNPVVYWVA